MLFSQLLIACAPATVAAPPVVPPVPAPLQIDDEDRVPGVNYRAPKTQLPYELPVDEPLEYERRWARRRVDLGTVQADAEHVSQLTMTVTGLDEAGNRILDWSVESGEWTRQKLGGNAMDQATDRGLAELTTGIEYAVRVSPKFRTVLLDDLVAANATAEAAVTRAEAAIEKEKFFYAQKQRAKSIVRSAVLTEELLEYSLLREPLILLDPLGRGYRMGEDRRWEDYFVNPIGTAPLEAWGRIEPLELDEEAGTLLVRSVKELDRVRAGAALAQDLDDWLKRTKVADREIDPETQFALREECRVLIDVERGLPLFAEHRSFVKIKADERVEKLRFTAKGFAPGPELTGDWFEPSGELIGFGSEPAEGDGDEG